jgi:hypothetical protein
MKYFRKTLAASVAGLGALVLVGNPVLADAKGPTQLAHMSQGQSGGQGYSGMGHGMMGQGYGYGHGHGMTGQAARPGAGATIPCPFATTQRMGPGMMGQGMGPGMMGQGMGPGMMGQGFGPGTMMGPGAGGYGARVTPPADLSTDDVRHFFEDRLASHGNDRLRVGEVKEGEDDAIIADIETVDGSLVQRYQVDRHSGAMRQVK